MQRDITLKALDVKGNNSLVLDVKGLNSQSIRC
jgi:hypothetical protein